MAVAWSVIKAVLSLLKLQKGVLFFGMPKSVINAELADKIVPLAKIPSTVESFMRKSDSMNVVH